MNLLRKYSVQTWCASSALLLAMGGCTQNPPGPTITEQTAATPEAMNSAEKPFSDYTQLTWQDNFDGASLDTKSWVPEVQDTWYNNEKQATTNSRDNLAVNNGSLLITARKQDYNGKQYTSARIITKGLKDFNFGRVDVRAKLPSGKGIWPAIWMLGSNDSQVSWPACGEIDIMELRGSTPQVSFTTMHFGSSVATHQQLGTNYPLPSGAKFSDDFHVFTVIRSLDKMRFFVDSVQYFTVEPKDVSVYPFNNPFYMILNVAVGGDFDGDPDASTVFPQQMEVDYVKYFKYKEE